MKVALAVLALWPMAAHGQYTSYARSANPATIMQYSTAGQAATTNWGTCGTTACAGGAGNSASLAQTTGVASPSVSGSAMALSFSSPASGNNALYYWKPGICDTCKWIRFEFDVWPSSGTANWEFDSFIVNTANNVDAMFGKQCNTVSGFWQYANQSSSWTNGPIPCSLVAGTQYHIVFVDHYDPLDTSAPGGLPWLYYDTITINGTTYSWAGSKIVATTVPTGWTHIFGCQFQMDSNAAATLTEYVDNVTCTVGN